MNVEFLNTKNDIRNNRGHWNNPKIIQTITDPHIGKARNFEMWNYYGRNTVNVEILNTKSDIRNNRGHWKNLKIIQTITDPHIGKARN